MRDMTPLASPTREARGHAAKTDRGLDAARAIVAEKWIRNPSRSLRGTGIGDSFRGKVNDSL